MKVVIDQILVEEEQGFQDVFFTFRLVFLWSITVNANQSEIEHLEGRTLQEIYILEQPAFHRYFIQEFYISFEKKVSLRHKKVHQNL